MKVQHVIGADLSKKTIDLFCYQLNTHLQIENASPGFTMLVKWMRDQKINGSNTMIVMEHTGLYSFLFENFLHQRHIPFCKVSALAIKKSMGIVRGKTDKLDAARIATYGYEKKDKLTADVPLNNALKRLQILYSTRGRLIRHKAALLNAIKEYKHIGLSQNDIIMRSQLNLVKDFSTQIQKLNKEMETIIEKEPSLMHNYSLLKTVKGIGEVIALTMIIKTHNFTRFANARKFACFCGTAPFEHSSGTSIRRNSKVSPLADKKIKSLLDLAAKSAIQNDKELKEYYLKRTQGGKSKMSTINIVRNKLLYRMFAVVKRQTPFVENYLQSA